jgi:hypothetical protein
VLRCAQGGRADTVTALMVTALMAITTGARESMLHHVEASIGRTPGRLQGLLHTARDAPISRRLKAADLAKSYTSMRELVVSAPRFAKASLACEDELEAKDCALDVLGTCLDATWDSVIETRARDPLMGRAMAEACALVGAMYAAAPANALAFMHSRVFAAMDAEFRQRMYAAAGHTEAGFFVMLADIVTSRDTADRMYQLLLGRTQGQGQGQSQGGALAITWDTLFDRFQGDEWTRDRHETALPVLQLTCKVARHSEAARTALAFTKWRYIKALLRSSCQTNVDAPARVSAMQCRTLPLALALAPPLGGMACIHTHAWRANCKVITPHAGRGLCAAGGVCRDADHRRERLGSSGRDIQRPHPPHVCGAPCTG